MREERITAAPSRLPALGALARVLAALCLATACARAPVTPLETLHVGLPYEIDSLDPHAAATVAGFVVLTNVYEPLARRDEYLRLQPTLAESWTNPAPDIWIFTLRSGVRFHDGAPLRAADVVSSLERVRTSPTLGLRYYLVDVSAVRALDARRVEVRTRGITPMLVNRLSFVPIVPERASAESLQSAPNGTGPYRLADWTPRRLVRLRRNDDYWGDRGEFSEAVFHLARSPEQMSRGLSEGLFQLAALGPGAAPPPGDRFERLDAPSPYVHYLGFDLAHERTAGGPNPFRDLRVRRALHVGIDRAAFVSRLGGGEAVGQLVSNVIFGFDPAIAVPPPDPAAARALLAEAGWGEGFDATVVTRTAFAASADLLAPFLAPLGIRLHVSSLPDPDFLALQQRGELSFWLDRWGCTTGDAGELFENALHSRDAVKGLGLFNVQGYGDAGLDLAIERARHLEDPGRRAALQAVMRKAMEDLPWVPLYAEKEVFALDRRLAWRPRYDFGIRIAEVRWRDGR